MLRFATLSNAVIAVANTAVKFRRPPAPDVWIRRWRMDISALNSSFSLSELGFIGLVGFLGLDTMGMSSLANMLNAPNSASSLSELGFVGLMGFLGLDTMGMSSLANMLNALNSSFSLSELGFLGLLKVPFVREDFWDWIL